MKAKKIKKLIKEIKNSKISHKKQIKSNKKINKFLKNLNKPPVEEIIPVPRFTDLKKKFIENGEVETVIIKKYVVAFKNGEVISGYYTEDTECEDEELFDRMFDQPPVEMDSPEQTEEVIDVVDTSTNDEIKNK